ncbi:YraN family protein [Cellvibrio polysaccharolyticus]|uniref:UPF0102 protein C4F51_14585 n=1 Tax=Cellvibrio polysaccharolyticus TaxID=2082724 RepID=A0A928V8G1_9GAMM|nr:YraN family protein [Cellvibrio polysaccharolyticus]MBE8718419.1 YraN family protein [Cellvibrio polysaccharolyticus]
MFFSSKDRTKLQGAQAETQAEQFLQQQGLVLQQKNFRCKAGEIDLIMRDQHYLVFVEVRLRSNRQFSSAAESVTWQKQQKIVRTAQIYLLKHNLLDKARCRFDVVTFDRLSGHPQWIKDAFGGA